MTKQILTLTGAFALFLLGLTPLSAQSLRGFNYQAIARDAAGNLLANQNATVVFDIRQGSAAGALIYQETHNTNTNAYGLINLVIGKGTAIVGNFAAIDWSANDYFLGVTLNGSPLGASALEAVPYSKVATDMDLDQLSDVNTSGAAPGQVLKWNGSGWVPATDETTDGDSSPTNEIQTLSLSGSALSLSLGGGSVNLPTGTTYSAGAGIAIAGSVISNTGDLSVTNEIQTLSLSGSTLSLSSGGGSVSLPAGTAYTAGAGIAIAGGVITNTGDTNAADDITNTTTAGGDLAGTYPNPTVDGLQGVAVVATAPTNGQVLKYNGSAWAPAADANTTYTAGAGLTLSGTTFAAVDQSATNEIQALSLSGSTLSLSNGGGSVALPSGTSSQWTTAGSNIHFNTGNVGIGDATPANTLTVGNGDKFQVSGTDGDVIFTDPQGTLRFPALTAPGAAPMIQMFSSGTQNADRMVIAHSPGFPTWGLEYKDSSDVFFLRNNSTRHFSFNLAQGRMGIGLGSDALSFPLEMAGRMRLRSTGSLSNSPGIWFQNNAGTFSRAFIGMSEPDSIIGIFSQHMNKWAIEFEVMREPRIGINIPAGSPPRAELHLYHTNFGGSNDGVRIQNEGANGHYWNLYTSNTTGAFEFFKSGIKRATINPTSGAYTAVSDARLKTNITTLSAAVLPSVMRLQAKTYQYIDVPDKRFFMGFLAQELEPLFPQFVYHGGDDQVMYTVDYAGLSVVALKAIQEQQATIEQLQEQLDEQGQLMKEQLRLLEVLARRVDELEQQDK